MDGHTRVNPCTLSGFPLKLEPVFSHFALPFGRCSSSLVLHKMSVPPSTVARPPHKKARIETTASAASCDAGAPDLFLDLIPNDALEHVVRGMSDLPKSEMLTYIDPFLSTTT